MRIATSRNDARPRIGVFDSGLGGLTVLRALRRILPAADYHYVGDTARVPYGAKSEATIRRYGLEIAAYLAATPLDALVVACNTVSAVAIAPLQKAHAVPVIGMVEPGAAAAFAVPRKLPARIGVICTPATKRSGAYERALHRLDPGAKVWVLACPLFVPLAEEGWTSGPVVQAVIDRYLAPLKKAKIDTLLLGCTHYPLLEEAFRQYFGAKVALVSSGEAAARQLAAILPAAGIVAHRKSALGRVKMDLTDPPADTTRALIERFLGEVAPEPGTLDLERFERLEKKKKKI